MKGKIGIIGSGAVAKVLGNGFLDNGWEVMLGTRNPQKLQEWLESVSEDAQIGSFSEALDFGDIIVLAVKGSVAADVLNSLNKDKAHGKTIIDATNPISDKPPQNGVLNFFTGPNSSLMEQLQDLWPEVNFVKAFNSVGGPHMVNPEFDHKPTMFICGNNLKAKKQVIEILEQFGWEAEDFGGVESARAIEPLCMLWCIPGILENRWSHVFKLLKK